ncbi:MAG: DUF4230 domain-containing protein [Prevotella sp.]
MKKLNKTLGIGMLVLIALVAGLLGFTIWTVKSCNVAAGEQGNIEITPVQIAKIQDIGQWEFLAISDEELIDTIRHGFFGDDELSRIYYGILRLGIDLKETEEGWIKMDHDTVTVVLPPIKLLDEKFIDEARTKAFYEDGKWSETAKAELTRKAERAMKARCLTPSNIHSAEQNASAQFNALLQSMGFEFTRIRFKERSKR